MPGHNSTGRVAELLSSSVMWPWKPGSLNPAVEPFVLHPGEYVLASTFEEVHLADDLAARLEGKSSLGRLGPVSYTHLTLPTKALV